MKYNTCFVCGSRSIEFLSKDAREALDKAIDQNYRFVVGDCDGVDYAVQLYLFEHGVKDVTVHYTGNKPRNIVGKYPTVCDSNIASWHEAKDHAMVKEADFGIAIWDGESKGTHHNMLNMKAFNKPVFCVSDVYIGWIEKKATEYEKAEAIRKMMVFECGFDVPKKDIAKNAYDLFGYVPDLSEHEKISKLIDSLTDDFSATLV